MNSEDPGSKNVSQKVSCFEELDVLYGGFEDSYGACKSCLDVRQK
jgi:hypothetical protein